MRRPVCVMALLLALTGCSGSDGRPGATSTTESPSDVPTQDAATGAPYLPVPEGVALTAQGSDLEVGDTATVAWEPRKNVVGALTVRVTRLEKASLKALAAFRLDDTQKRSAPYYVRATVKNVGDTDLASVSVPLYLLDGRDTLIQATPFDARFRPCPSTPLPEPFGTGAKAAVCLLFLVPDRGRLAAVSFRPTQEYDPITWTGTLEEPKPTKKRD